MKSLTPVQGDGSFRSELCSKGRSAKQHFHFWWSLAVRKFKNLPCLAVGHVEPLCVSLIQLWSGI